MALRVADASTFSAAHSDVSYAVPDSGYSWSETDASEISGKSFHLFLRILYRASNPTVLHG